MPKHQHPYISPSTKPATPRLPALDWLRGVAIVSMVIFHFMYDLAIFGYIDQRTMFQPSWKLFGSLILGTFLMVSGFSQYWSWRHRFNPKSYFRRLTILLIAAYGLITLTTYLQNSDSFIFHGVLHHMAFGSLILLGLHRILELLPKNLQAILPPIILGVLALLVSQAPRLFTSTLFNSPLLWWLGLSSDHPSSPDFVPLAPWFWIMLVGAILGKSLSAGLVIKLGAIGSSSRPGKFLGWLGRYSIWIYLVHQPILYGGFHLYSMIKS